MRRFIHRRSGGPRIKYAYIKSVNDKGRTVLKGPYPPGHAVEIEEIRDRMNRDSSVVYLPTSNINSASSMVRNRFSEDYGINEASEMRIKHEPA